MKLNYRNQRRKKKLLTKPIKVTNNYQNYFYLCNVNYLKMEPITNSGQEKGIINFLFACGAFCIILGAATISMQVVCLVRLLSH